MKKPIYLCMEKIFYLFEIKDGQKAYQFTSGLVPFFKWHWIFLVETWASRNIYMSWYFFSIYMKFTRMCYMIDYMIYSISWSMLLDFNIVILFNNMVQTNKHWQDAKNNYFRPQRAPVFMTGFIVVRIKLWDKKEKKSPIRY